MILKIIDIQSAYGNILVLKGITLEVNKGEIVCLIGANGAGKTTLLKTISGLIHTKNGKIIYNNEEIQNLKPHHITQKGILHIPEGRKIFSRMTVLENLQMGAFLKKNKTKIKNDLEKVYNLFPILKERTKQMGGTLSGGEQQMLAISRALMGEPELLLMDEPSMGLSPLFTEKIFEKIKEIREMGVSILLVEQNALGALKISDRGYCLETGKIILSDLSKNLLVNNKVKEAYLI